MSQKINWSQFKLEPSKPNLITGWDIFTFTGIDKPNLIENGWDGFEPHPYSENLFKLSEKGIENTKEDTTTMDGGWNVWSERVDCSKNKEFRIAGKWNKLYDEEALPHWHIVEVDKDGNRVKAHNLYFDSDNFEADSKTFTAQEESVSFDLHYNAKNGKNQLQFKNMVVVPIDAPAVIKTSLDNGLTRIQTWGGNHPLKLQGPRLDKGFDWTYSFYVESNRYLRVTNVEEWGKGGVVVEENSKQFVQKYQTGNEFIARMLLWSDNVSGNLDFIASDPEIVKAKYPNIKVIMNQENTLMHIKTFGGNDKRKLYGTIGRFPSGSRFQQSIYIENYGPDVYVSGHTGTVERHKIETGYKGWMHFPAWVDGPSWMDFSFGAETPDECLDFKCTLPQIVEGDVPNPELVVQTLDDGREHVRVFGATPETKLVYDEAGFKGELYSFKTEIENQGTHLKMKSSIGDYEEVIDEGTKEIKHEGNLNSAKVEFEVGATDE